MILRALALSAVLALAAHAQIHAQPAPLPVIQQNGQAKQLMVDNKPYLILGGELHNSSASSAAYMDPIWPRLAALHLNTVIGTVSWELLEPEEGKFDFSLVDMQLAGARAHNLRLVLCWFGSWKNTGSNYVPVWVKQDKKRFFWAAQHQNPEPGHRGLYALSAFCKPCQDADAHAYAALMRHLRETDPQHTVLMMQVENEMGILTDGREFSPAANAAWNQQVPATLITFLQSHRATLRPELPATWAAAGNKTSGTWPQVFGDNLNGEEVFSAWHFSQYTGAIIAAGKRELALPMYVNAWLVGPPTAVPGSYPSGGPVSRMMDVWHASAPQVDLLAPDAYNADNDGTFARYAVDGNPLFFPESRAIPGNYLWAFGHYNAIGVSPFGVDDLRDTDPLGKVYEALSGAMPLITRAQSAGTIAAIQPASSGTSVIKLGGFDIHASFVASKKTAAIINGVAAPDVALSQEALTDGKTGYAMIIQASDPNEFYIMGTNLVLEFDRPTGEDNDWVVYDIEEGSFANGKWLPGRHLNGDESSGLRKLALPGQFTLRRIRLYKHPGPGSMG
jgi:hypothetical protein